MYVAGTGHTHTKRREMHLLWNEDSSSGLSTAQMIGFRNISSLLLFLRFPLLRNNSVENKIDISGHKWLLNLVSEYLC